MLASSGKDGQGNKNLVRHEYIDCDSVTTGVRGVLGRVADLRIYLGGIFGGLLSRVLLSLRTVPHRYVVVGITNVL